ncbi:MULTISPECIES: hypothetical protein [unclassified Neptuniibacter]|uniref:hypothetical protein n=1 Tax=unclassified Neptuniibacter TaxID=2630693 RepID=UPI0025E0431D|nr:MULTISPECIES: hypothetical protein [unclassified Neptuniibacter]|tara:strand:- start:113 stop:1111 length:999 start_codon:yes stop_codon:yes gene_type:complete
MKFQYPDTAYNSNDMPVQSASKWDNSLLDKFKLSNATLLHFNELSNQIPRTFSNKCELDDYQDNTIETPWDEKLFTKGQGNIWFRFFFLIGAFTEIFLTFLLPITFIAYIVVHFALYEEGIYDDSSYISDVILSLKFCFYFFGLSALYQLYYRKLAFINGNVPFFIKLYREYELCRQTGMVHIYKKNKEVFSAPFYEFDCYLASNPGNYGELFYTMQLVHRYKGTKHTVDLGALIGNSAPPEEYYQLWNMMQQYMDISRPMPDNIMSEAYRHLDPTTAAYDKKTGRDSHFWRNMTQEEYEAELERREEAQKSIPLEGEDIMRWKKPDQPFVA